MLMIENVDQRSKDYSDIKDKYRPGHADYTYDVKYGIHDYRGGGRASARETAARVAAGRDRTQDRARDDRARRAGADGTAQDRPVALGLERDRTAIRSSAPMRKQAKFFEEYLDDVRKAGSSVRRGHRGRGRRRSGGARRAGLWQARRRSRRGADGHQRGQGRRDRRRLCRRGAQRRRECR